MLLGSLLNRTDIIFALERVKIFFFGLVLLCQSRHDLANLGKICSDKIMINRGEQIDTHSIAIGFESGTDVLDRSFNKNTTNKAEAFSVRILCQGFIESRKDEADEGH